MFALNSTSDYNAIQLPLMHNIINRTYLSNQFKHMITMPIMFVPPNLHAYIF